MPNHHDTAVEELRHRIAHLERSGRIRRGVLPTGVAALDDHLPDRGLARGALHEFFSGGADLGHAAAPARFIASILARQKPPVLWVQRRRDLFAPGLATAGLHPDRVIYAETGRDDAVLPIAEEGLRHRGLVAVVAECARLTLTASRRLQLAAEASGVACLVIRRWTGHAEPEADGTVAVTRWRLTALRSGAQGDTPGLGDPRWQLELLRCRGGEPATFTLEACDETGRLRMVPDLADRPAEAERQRAAFG